VDKKEFSERLSKLRLQKGVSARDMSLSLGQSPGYINNIENGVNMPSMAQFFIICEFLDVTPAEFFNLDNTHPNKMNRLLQYAMHLSPEQVDLLIAVADNFK
jgi:transcriptional regulator with XRE-family HTH domain